VVRIEGGADECVDAETTAAVVDLAYGISRDGMVPVRLGWNNFEV